MEDNVASIGIFLIPECFLENCKISRELDKYGLSRSVYSKQNAVCYIYFQKKAH